jgi:hypothetical protein
LSSRDLRSKALMSKSCLPSICPPTGLEARRRAQFDRHQPGQRVKRRRLVEGQDDLVEISDALARIRR